MNDSDDRLSFAIESSFQGAQPHGGLQLGPLELSYQELFAEALEDGVITPDERARLKKAADNLGIDPSRLERLEDAMTAAYETHHRVRVVDQTLTPHHSLSPLEGAPPLSSRGVAPPAASPASTTASAPPPLIAAASPEVERLRQENERLRTELTGLHSRVTALEEELVRAQASVNVEVDLTGFEADAALIEDPDEVWKRVRRDPSDAEALRALKSAFESQGDVDGAYLATSALLSLEAASPEEAAWVEGLRTHSLIAPAAGFDESTWANTLFHPEEDPLTGALFSVIAPAVLVGRVTTLRRDRMLHVPPADSAQDPKSSTVMAVRAVGWAAALLGLPVPTTHVEPETDAGYVHAAGMPPFTVLGSRALSGRTATELAFLVGRHMCGYRGEHFVRTLFTGTEDLEDLFLAALLIANSQLPLTGSKRARVEPLARAIEPMLDASAHERLRTAYLQFAEAGGRTNLQKWSAATRMSAARVGLALSQDLPAAAELLAEEEGSQGPLVLDLVAFSTSPRFRALRKQLDISLKSDAFQP